MTMLAAVAVSLGVAVVAFAGTAYPAKQIERQTGLTLASLAFGVATAASVAAPTLRLLHSDASGIAAGYSTIGGLALARVVWVMARTGSMSRWILAVLCFGLGLGVIIAGGWVLDRLMPDGTAKTVMEWLVIGMAVTVFVGVPIAARSSRSSGDANRQPRDPLIERRPPSGE